MSNNITDDFVRSIMELQNKEIDDITEENIKKCLLDYVGVTLAGSTILKKNNEIIMEKNGTKGNFKPIGLNKKTDVLTASLINGLSSHVLELDDGIRYGVIHPGVSIFSALLPLFCNGNYKISDFKKAILIGYETSIRLSYSMQPSHYIKGYHPSSSCGIVGAAAAIATLKKYNFQDFKNIISISMVVSGGSLKVIEKKSTIKPFNIGNASMTAILASHITEAGYLAPDDALGGDTGFFSIMCEKFNKNILLNPNQWKFAINNVYFKLYAACRHCHPTIEAILTLRNKIEDLNLVESIKIETYKGVIGKHDNKIIDSISSAKMSIPYCAAVTLLYGEYSLNAFDEKYINDEKIINLIPHISISANEELSNLVPKIRAAIVTINLNNGISLTHRINYPKGEPENPLSKKGIETKFKELAIFSGKKKNEIKKVINCIWNIEESFEDLKDLL